MDINYHYFAIKTIAVKAGFTKEDAQTLAIYSQLIDDFDIYRYLKVDYVPEFAQPLARKIPLIGWLFNPITTGFNSNGDYSRLTSTVYQRTITVPFHFIPKTVYINGSFKYDAVSLRTVPAHFGDKSTLMGELASEACDKYRSEKSRYNLIRIGMLLHIFADTYAHQRFSGFHGWENHSELTNVINNIDNTQITSSYSPTKYYYFPSIGHANVNHAPDDSNVSFEMKQKENKKSKEYTSLYKRNNTEEFLLASREIYNFLSSCLKNENVTVLDEVWNPFSDNLKNGLLTSSKKVDELITHWKKFFVDDEYEYNYNKNEIIGNNFKVLESGASSTKDIDKNLNEYGTENKLIVNNEDFFIFNMVAAEICNRVNGFTDYKFLNRNFNTFCFNY